MTNYLIIILLLYELYLSCDNLNSFW